MAKIENNISSQANIYTFDGVEYDMQLTMYVVSQFEDFNDVLNSMGKVETIFKMAAAMMNSFIKKNKLDLPAVDADYLSASTTMQELPHLTDVIAKAMGLKPKTEVEDEFDKIADAEGITEIKN